MERSQGFGMLRGACLSGRLPIKQRYERMRKGVLLISKLRSGGTLVFSPTIQKKNT